MWIFPKFLKSEINKKNIIISLLLLSITVSIMYIFISHTKISIHSGFNNANIHHKIIDPIYVFISNSTLLISNLLFGIPTFGIFVVMTIIENIYALIVIMNSLFLANDINSIFRLIPHGILELFILIWAFVKSIEISILLFKTIRSLIIRENFLKQNFKQCINKIISSIILIAFLLFIAAILEYIVSIFI